MPSLILYLSQYACSMAPHIALVEAGAKFSTVHVALGKGEQHSSTYLEVNPHAQVPALAIGDEMLTENIAIAYWIDKAYPDVHLLPAQTRDAKAQVLAIFAWLNSSVHPAFGPLFHPERFVNDKQAQADLTQHAREKIARHFDEINDRLRGREWLFDTFSIVDCYLFAMANWAQNVFRMDLAGKSPHLHAHFERMLSRPSVKQVLKDEVELAAAG